MLDSNLTTIPEDPTRVDQVKPAEETAAIDLKTFSTVIKALSEQLQRAENPHTLEALLKLVHDTLVSLGLTDPRLFTKTNLAKILRNSLNNLLISDFTPAFVTWLEDATASSEEFLMASGAGKYILDPQGEKFALVASDTIDTSVTKIEDIDQFISSFDGGNVLVKGDQAFDLLHKLKKTNLPYDTYITSRGTIYAYKINGGVLVIDKTFRNVNKVELVGDYLNTEFENFVTQSGTAISTRAGIVKQYLEQLSAAEYTEEFNQANTLEDTVNARKVPLEFVAGGFATGVDVLKAVFKLANIFSDLEDVLLNQDKTDELIYDLCSGLFRLTDLHSKNITESGDKDIDLNAMYREASNPNNPIMAYLRAVVAGDHAALMSNPHLSQEVTFEKKQVKLYQALDSIISSRYYLREINFDQNAVEVMRKSFGSIPLHLAKMHLEMLGIINFNKVNSDLFVQEHGAEELSKLKVDPKATEMIEKMANAKSVKTGCPAILGGNIEVIKSLYLKFIERFTAAGF